MYMPTVKSHYVNSTFKNTVRTSIKNHILTFFEINADNEYWPFLKPSFKATFQTIDDIGLIKMLYSDTRLLRAHHGHLQVRKIVRYKDISRFQDYTIVSIDPGLRQTASDDDEDGNHYAGDKNRDAPSGKVLLAIGMGDFSGGTIVQGHIANGRTDDDRPNSSHHQIDDRNRSPADI
ncbi:hypothetical protein BG000_005169 [Podila horticola]|nr:hypothetical protein BG000_005169 [Podila horticola]